MDRRQALAEMAAAGLIASRLVMQARGAENAAAAYLELKTWRLHNSAEEQAARVADFIENGLGPALLRTGAALADAFSNAIGPHGPFYLTLTQYASLAAMQDTLGKLEKDGSYQGEVRKLSAGPGLPFVRIESSLLKSAKGADARRQTEEEFAEPLGGALDTGPVLREFLRKLRCAPSTRHCRRLRKTRPESLRASHV